MFQTQHLHSVNKARLSDLYCIGADGFIIVWYVKEGKGQPLLNEKKSWKGVYTWHEHKQKMEYSEKFDTLFMW